MSIDDFPRYPLLFGPSPVHPLERLTARETAVVAALVAGVDTREVARTLHISDWTVQDHLKSVFAKLGVHSRRDALARLAGQSLPRS